MKVWNMKDFFKKILVEQLGETINVEDFYNNSPLLKYLDSKMGAIYGNSKSRRSLANIYAVYSIIYFYVEEFFSNKESYKNFEGYDYTKLFNFYRGLYGGSKLQNHALNSRVNGEFKNKIVSEHDNDLIIVNNGKYALHIEYLYVDHIDISKIAKKAIEEYIAILELKDSKLIGDINLLINLETTDEKKTKLKELLDEDSEARIFEIISYAILKNHYKNIKIYIGYSTETLKEEYLTLYRTGRTNANDGGIDFVMRPLGRFFQVTEVNNYDKYLLDMDKVMHFPVTFIIKTKKTEDIIQSELMDYIKKKSKGMKIIEDRYNNAIEEIVTINELRNWLEELNDESTDNLLRDIDIYYRLELNI